MSTDEKLAALKALTITHLEMRKPGDWYVSAHGRECVEGGMLVSHYGNGNSPQAAIEDDWEQISVAKRIRVGNREVYWNGYMWEEVAK